MATTFVEQARPRARRRDYAGPLVRAALSDDTEQLIEAAAMELRRPVGLVTSGGDPLGGAPAGNAGARALAMAAAAARSGLVAPPGWELLPVSRGSVVLGWLALGRNDPGASQSAVELVIALVAEHVQRRELLRSHRTDLVRRLLSEPGASSARLRAQALELGLALADAYWAAVLSWRHLAPSSDVVARVVREGGIAAGGLAVGVGSFLVLLHPVGSPPAWFEDTVRLARRLAPAAGAQAVVASSAVSLDALGACVSDLEALWRLGPRASSEPVLAAERFALDRLLAGLAGGREAREFVRGQLGPLLDWDAAHGSDLVRVLEASLDLPLLERAAAACFMHRNTFRHRLRQASEVLGRDLEDPDVRLAVHVALKLRRL